MVISVVDGSASVNKIATDIEAGCTNWTAHTKCVPLIPYEDFAKTSLGVKDGEVEKKGATPAFVPGKETYWVQAEINYPGLLLL